MTTNFRTDRLIQSPEVQAIALYSGQDMLNVENGTLLAESMPTVARLVNALVKKEGFRNPLLERRSSSASTASSLSAKVDFILQDDLVLFRFDGTPSYSQIGIKQFEDSIQEDIHAIMALIKKTWAQSVRTQGQAAQFQEDLRAAADSNHRLAKDLEQHQRASAETERQLREALEEQQKLVDQTKAQLEGARVEFTLQDEQYKKRIAELEESLRKAQESEKKAREELADFIQKTDEERARLFNVFKRLSAAVEITNQRYLEQLTLSQRPSSLQERKIEELPPAPPPAPAPGLPAQQEKAYQKTIAELEDSLQSTSTELQSVRDSKAPLEEELTKARAILSQLREDLHKLQNKPASPLAKLIDGLESAHLAKLTELKAVAESQLARLKREIEDEQRKISTAQEAMRSGIDIDRNQAITVASRTKIKELEERKHRIERELRESTQAENTDFKLRKEKAIQEFQADQGDFSDLPKELRAFAAAEKKRIADKEAQIQSLLQTIQEKKELLEASQARVSKLEAEVAALERKIEELTAENARIKQELAAHLQTIETSRRENADLRTQLESLSQLEVQHSALQVEQARDKEALRKTNEALEKARLQLEALATRTSQAVEVQTDALGPSEELLALQETEQGLRREILQLEEAKLALEEKAKRTDALEEEARTLGERLHQLQEENEALQSQLSDNQSTIKSNALQMKSLEERIQTLELIEKEYKALQLLETENKRKLEKAEAALQTLALRLESIANTLPKEVFALRAQEASLRKEIERLQKEGAELKEKSREVYALQVEIFSLGRQVSQLEDDRAQIQARLEASEQGILKKSLEIQELKTRIETLRKFEELYTGLQALQEKSRLELREKNTHLASLQKQLESLTARTSASVSTQTDAPEEAEDPFANMNVTDLNLERQILELRARIEQIQREKAQLQEDVAQEIESLKQQFIEALTSIDAAHQEVIASLHGENEELQASVQKSNLELERLRQLVDQLSALKEPFSDEEDNALSEPSSPDALTEKANALMDNIIKTFGELSGEADRDDDDEPELDAQDPEIASLRSTIQLLETALAEKQADLKQARQTQFDDLKRMEEANTKATEAYASQIKEAEATNQRLLADLKKAQGKIEKIQVELIAARAANTRATGELKESLIRIVADLHKKPQTAGLQVLLPVIDRNMKEARTLEDFVAVMKHLQEALASTSAGSSSGNKQEIEGLKKSLLSMIEVLPQDILAVQMVEVKIRKASTLEDVITLMPQVQKIVAHISSLYASGVDEFEFEQLQQRVRELEEEQTLYYQTNEELMHQLKESQALVERLTTQHETVRAPVAVPKDSPTSESMRQLEKEKKELEEKNESLIQEIITLSIKLYSLENEVSQQIEAKKRLKEEHAEQIADRDYAVESAEESKRKAAKNLEDTQAECQRLRQKAASIEAQFEDQEQQIQRLNEVIDSLRQQLAAEGRKNKPLETEIETLEEKLRVAKLQIEEKDWEIEERQKLLRKSIEEAPFFVEAEETSSEDDLFKTYRAGERTKEGQAYLESLNEELFEERKRNAVLDKTNTVLTDQLSEAQRKIESHDEEMESLREQLRAMTEKAELAQAAALKSFTMLTPEQQRTLMDKDFTFDAEDATYVPQEIESS